MAAGRQATVRSCAAPLERRGLPKKSSISPSRCCRRLFVAFPRERLALHVCRGNWTRDESAALAGNYTPLVPLFSSIPVGTLFLELCTPRAGEIDVLKTCRAKSGLAWAWSIKSQTGWNPRGDRGSAPSAPSRFSEPTGSSSTPTAASPPLPTARSARFRRRQSQADKPRQGEPDPAFKGRSDVTRPIALAG